jgi:hypothetical protein
MSANHIPPRKYAPRSHISVPVIFRGGFILAVLAGAGFAVFHILTS